MARRDALGSAPGSQVRLVSRVCVDLGGPSAALPSGADTFKAGKEWLAAAEETNCWCRSLDEIAPALVHHDERLALLLRV